jgi:hypothetical protein
MNRVIREEVIDTPAGQMVTTVEDSTIVVPTEDERHWGDLIRLRQVVYFIASAIAILIMIRFALLALAANMATGFGNLIATVTNPLVTPFSGLFSTPVSEGGSVFELSSIVAVAVYFLLAWAIVKIATLVYAPKTTTPTI